ncbi:gpW family head-tail joining protein [Tropicibacter sp. S64]|uniref:gpW family head-tail joining protein n=1 Tax=Tropicibacter sp. S64 TaxID=3415122 RepID=UPI003C7DCDF0
MATLAERLAEAENALHDLLLGQQSVEVRDSNGESVRFTPTRARRACACRASDHEGRS